MKFSNEVKVSAFIVVTVALLLYGYNFLKGRDFFNPNTTIYAQFEPEGDIISRGEVKINGLRVGDVYAIKQIGETRSRLRVTLHLNNGVKIPANSVAYIKPPFAGLGSSEVIIEKGDATTFLKENDTIKTIPEPEDTSGHSIIKGKEIEPSKLLQIIADAIDSVKKDSSRK